MNKAFQVHPEDGTVSVHQDRINPAEIQSLIRELETSLTIILRMKADPIDVLNKSVRLNRSERMISFQLNWNAPVIHYCVDDDLPAPNVPLTEEQTQQFYRLVAAMVSGI